ncbi:hypothetical protein TWF481_009231 [Arthrobotrys musiformis]|uniref:Uncharacterized protein n=1 Tax=Arthrobotrys musiformis TaxID=47236 RepID=A0AAV9W8V4_9PEZI
MSSSQFRKENSSRASRRRTSSVLQTALTIASLACPHQARGQTSDPTTSTIYTTVENTLTITSTLGSCSTWTGLPQCDQVVWGNFASNVSTSSDLILTTTTSTNPATTSIAAPRGGFVLEETLGGIYFQLDDDTGRAVLAATGQDRFVALTLQENVENLLQNARDSSEILFLRYNASANQALEQESTEVLSLLREIRHTLDAEGDIQSSDYVGEWVWNTTTGQVELHQDGIRWIIYEVGDVANSPIRNRDPKFANRANFYDLYMLPADIEVSENSTLQTAQFVANDEDRYVTSYFSSIDSEATSSETGTITTTSGPVSSSGGTSSRSSGSGSNTTPRSTFNSGSSLASSSASIDVYDIITSLSLEAYCSSILSYTSPVITTTSTLTSTSTSYYAFSTEPSSTSTSTKTIGDTSVTTFVSASAATAKRDLNLDASRRSPEDELTGYPSGSILSACSRAASSPTGTATETSTASAYSDISEPASSTTQFGIANATTTTYVPIFTEVVPAIGAYKFIYKDLSDHSGTYYGQYITGAYDNSPGYSKASTSRPVLNWSLYYFESVGSYGLIRTYSGGGESMDTVLVWTGAGGGEPEDTVNKFVVYEYPLSTVIDGTGDYRPIYFKLDPTTLVISPDDAHNPVSNGTFWACTLSLPLYFANPTIFMALGDFDTVIGTSDCVNTGLTALQGGY